MPEKKEIAHGAYLLPEITKNIAPGTIKTIIELGGGNGLDSIALSQHYFGSKVYCFECNPESIYKCEEYLKNTEITLIKKAVSDIDGIIDFYPNTDGRYLTSAIYKAVDNYPEKLEQGKIKVKSTRLDTWMKGNKIEQVDLICADIQGAFLKAMKGMGDYIYKVKYIIAEIETKPIYQGEDLFDETYKYLADHGFILIDSRKETDYFGDYIFVNIKL